MESKTQIYNEQIDAPLKQLVDIAEENKIPFYAVCQVETGKAFSSGYIPNDSDGRLALIRRIVEADTLEALSTLLVEAAERATLMFLADAVKQLASKDA